MRRPVESPSQHYNHRDNEESPESVPLQTLKQEEEEFSDDKDDASSVQSFELYTPDEENAVVRKLDTRLVLFLAFLYMLSFLDRSS